MGRMVEAMGGSPADGANMELQSIYTSQDVVQVNIPAESGEMGVLANHVPSIEQLKPGLVEIIEESGGSKQFFRTFTSTRRIHSLMSGSLRRIRSRAAKLVFEHQRG